MIVHYPMTTNLLTEARLYATDSIQHTMDYEGWKDQHQKRERIVYGNFGQLWVAEFCRLNGIPYQKDRSSPERPDDFDLIAHGFKIDVKTSVCKDLVGQVSPGVINKPVDYFCFMLTDKLCTYIAPYGLIAADDYRRIAVEVKQGEIIPGTTRSQRFSKSYFLPPDAELMPFVQFMRSQGRAKSRVIQPSTIVDGRAIEDIEQQLATLTRVNMEIVKAMSSMRKPRGGNVVSLPSTNDLFAKGDAA